MTDLILQVLAYAALGIGTLLLLAIIGVLVAIAIGVLREALP